MENNIRNFVIIAHIDHGKSTLADRFLELTGAVEKRQMKEQFLDQMDLEREKGITIKMQPIGLRYTFEGVEYQLNLIDTPGHADFGYEVSRSLAAVEGAILLVDATKGVQAQTLANLKLAKEQGLTIVSAVNKIDLPSARVKEVTKSIVDLLEVEEKDILHISAKTGQGIEELLQTVIAKVPPAKQEIEKPLRALVFDSHFDAFKGVVAYVRVVEGRIQTNDQVFLKASREKVIAKEVGHFTPKEVPDTGLQAGQIGYIATGLKEADLVRIGDTITHAETSQVEQLAGYKPSKPVVFVSFFPQDPNNFDELKDAIWKLKLNDPALEYDPEAHEALGRGFRCGFLGVLHSEIISERLQREYKVPLVISRPSVEFQVVNTKGKEISVKTAADWPEENLVQSVKEPWVWLDIVMPNEYYSQVVQLLAQLEGQQLETNNLSESTLSLLYETPLREIVIDFYDKLKSATAGMASMDYQISDWREANLVKLEIHIAGQKEEAFSQVVSRSRAYREGSTITKKLKDLLPQQQFPVAIQAVVGGDVIARETLKASRRDVTGALYGGDVTRKKKLLEKQKKGKKELEAKGRVHIPSKVFLDVFRT